jgi:hypothetical protein
MAAIGYALGVVMLLAAAVLGATAREGEAEARARYQACIANLRPAQWAACGGSSPAWDIGRLAVAANTAGAGYVLLLLAGTRRRTDRIEAAVAGLAQRLEKQAQPPAPPVSKESAAGAPVAPLEPDMEARARQFVAMAGLRGLQMDISTARRKVLAEAEEQRRGGRHG